MNKQTEDALRMAIEMLEIAKKETKAFDYIGYEKTINACKAALEKPNMTYEQGFAHGYEAHRAETALETELSGNSGQLEQEPVAWFLQRKDSYEFSFSKPLITSEYLAVEPLYTGPTKSLSDNEIFELCPYIDHDLFEEAFYRGARAIEKAHGIGE
jgi:hypothetical protein